MYNERNLSVLSYANGFTLWHYRTDDTRTTVLASGYFSEAADVVRKGDAIHCNLGDYTDFTTLWVTAHAPAPVNVVVVQEVGA